MTKRKVIQFDTQAERDAFRRGWLWEQDEYPADLVTGFLDGKWRVEMVEISEEDL